MKRRKFMLSVDIRVYEALIAEGEAKGLSIQEVTRLIIGKHLEPALRVQQEQRKYSPAPQNPTPWKLPP